MVKLSTLLLCLFILAGCSPQPEQSQSNSPATPMGKKPSAGKKRVFITKEQSVPAVEITVSEEASELEKESIQQKEAVDNTSTEMEEEATKLIEPRVIVPESDEMAKPIEGPQFVEPDQPTEQPKPEVAKPSVDTEEIAIETILEIKTPEPKPEPVVIKPTETQPKPAKPIEPAQPQILTPESAPAPESEVNVAEITGKEEIELVTTPTAPQPKPQPEFTTQLTVVYAGISPLYFISGDELIASVPPSSTQKAVTYTGSRELDIWKPSGASDVSIDSVMELAGTVTLTGDAPSYQLICTLVKIGSGIFDYTFELIPEGTEPPAQPKKLEVEATPPSEPADDTILPRRKIVYPNRTI